MEESGETDETVETGDDYNDNDEDDGLIGLINQKYSGEPPSLEEMESEEVPLSEEEVGGGLPPGTPDIPGLYMEKGVMKYKGEKVTSITGMDGKDKGEKVYADENEVEDEDEDEVVEVQSIENLSEVEKLTPIKSLSEIKSLLPVKSIKEIANIDEVKEILPIPENLAREFIKKHKLKHGRKHTVSGESELPADVEEYPAQGGRAESSSEEIDVEIDEPDSDSFLNIMEGQLQKVQKEVQAAMELLENHKNMFDDPQLTPPVDFPVEEAETAVSQGGAAYEEEDEESEEDSSDEVTYISNCCRRRPHLATDGRGRVPPISPPFS